MSTTRAIFHVLYRFRSTCRELLKTAFLNTIENTSPMIATNAGFSSTWSRDRTLTVLKVEGVLAQKAVQYGVI